MFFEFFLNSLQYITSFQSLLALSMTWYLAKDASLFSFWLFYVTSTFLTFGLYCIGFTGLVTSLIYIYLLTIGYFFLFYMQHCRYNTSNGVLAFIQDFYSFFACAPTLVAAWYHAVHVHEIPEKHVIKTHTLELSVLYVPDPRLDFTFGFTKSYFMYIIISLFLIFTFRRLWHHFENRRQNTAGIRFVNSFFIGYYSFMSVLVPGLIYYSCLASQDKSFPIFKIDSYKWSIHFKEVIFHNLGISSTFYFNEVLLMLVTAIIFLLLFIFPYFIYKFYVKAKRDRLNEEEAKILALAEAKALELAEAKAFALTEARALVVALDLLESEWAAEAESLAESKRAPRHDRRDRDD
jgi:hypothetical protein